MKKIITLIAVVLTMLAFSNAVTVEAAPFKANDKNPNVVSYYPGPDDVHAIPLDPVIHLTGIDLVMRNGNSENFNQWYYSEEHGGYHSVWKIRKPNQEVMEGWVLIENANPIGDDVGWGDHLVEGADYFVKTNQFKIN